LVNAYAVNETRTRISSNAVYEPSIIIELVKIDMPNIEIKIVVGEINVYKKIAMADMHAMIHVALITSMSQSITRQSD
jgi:hypothetical protein